MNAGAVALAVNEGITVDIGNDGMVRVIGGGRVNVGVEAGWKKRIGKLPQQIVAIRMNIIINKRRMDIL